MVKKEKQKDFKNTDKRMKRKITIGRDASCQIQVNDPSQKVSRIHASLFWDGHRLILEDQSTNGTVVNGRFVHHSKIEIKKGDAIYLGNTVLLSWNEINQFISSNQGHEHRSFRNKSTLWMFGFVGMVVIVIVCVVISKSAPDDGSFVDQDGDCRIFTTSSFTWDGSCLDGYANGTGTLRWTSGKKYYGKICNGHITGNGKQYANEELVYEGDFVDEKWDGEGKEYNNGNLIYEGHFKNGYREGRGKEYDNRKLVYEGDFRQGKRQGSGTLYQDNYPIYVGEFSNNNFDGYGTLYFDYSTEITRKGHFVNGNFRDEEKANDICEQVGRQIVNEIFMGGTNIQSNLYAIKMDRMEENVEMTLDLTFNGNRIRSNFYSCKVIVRNNREPLLEFMESNDNASVWINIHDYMEDIINIVNILKGF
jgi:hypothetical protein